MGLCFCGHILCQFDYLEINVSKDVTIIGKSVANFGSPNTGLPSAPVNIKSSTSTSRCNFISFTSGAKASLYFLMVTTPPRKEDIGLLERLLYLGENEIPAKRCWREHCFEIHLGVR